jgi:hypothetical protein
MKKGCGAMIEHVQAELIQNLEDGVRVIVCGFCEHRGHKPTAMRGWEVQGWAPSAVCPICDGRGVLEVESPDHPVYDAYCNGTGHEPDTSLDQGLPDVPCHMCRGLGVRSLHGKLRLLGEPRAREVSG